MTTTKRRSALTNLVIFCIVAAAGVAVYRAIAHTTQGVLADERELVTFTVTFVPLTRDQPVHVQLGAGSAPAESHYPTESPLIVTKMMHPGEAATLTVEQFEYGVVRCKIRAGMRSVVKEKEHIGMSGGVACLGIV